MRLLVVNEASCRASNLLVVSHTVCRTEFDNCQNTTRQTIYRLWNSESGSRRYHSLDIYPLESTEYLRIDRRRQD